MRDVTEKAIELAIEVFEKIPDWEKRDDDIHVGHHLEKALEWLTNN